MIWWSIFNKLTEPHTLEHVSHHVRPGTILHSAISELDDDSRSKYIKSLKASLDEPPELKKYTRAIRVGLLAGLLTEFIVKGADAKPITVISRTITYSILAVLVG